MNTQVQTNATYVCSRCGQPLFQEDEIISRRPLWDLGEEKSEVYVLRSAAGLASLRRYDASLHQGWYCCRFALMRMTYDKFNTGDKLLAYVSDVVRVAPGERAALAGDFHPGQTQLGAQDFDHVLRSAPTGTLSVVKFSATWCPPCRMLDAAIARIHQAKQLPGVQFYEVDVDQEQSLGERFAITSLPTIQLWHKGEQFIAKSSRWASHAGSFIGAVSERVMIEILSAEQRRIVS